MLLNEQGLMARPISGDAYNLFSIYRTINNILGVVTLMPLYSLGNLAFSLFIAPRAGDRRGSAAYMIKSLLSELYMVNNVLR
jgi:hypothetical protein